MAGVRFYNYSFMDEERCREMSAAFLQGYKYSRPVPIEKLREFLPKAS
ncbi:MAG: hypothetical protein IK099_08230 [Clostridia bacterium]|nr:hypothetical protein [Clostridia bacterium]